MKKLALFLSVGVLGAGLSTAEAQVFSINAVGYVNVQLSPGFNLVSNPLDSLDNTVASLFANISPAVPDGLKIFIYNEQTGAFDSEDIGSREIKVGQGAFVFNPSSETVTVTFVGNVLQGELRNPLPTGFSIKANQVPQAGRPDLFGLAGERGDRMYRFNKIAGGFDSYTYQGMFHRWSPALPEIQVGEAFLYFKAGSAGEWVQSFNVNNPAGIN